MAAKRLDPAEPESTLGQQIHKVLFDARAKQIREARARVPRPSYDQIAVEVGCSVKTVYNICTNKTHAVR